MKNPKIRDPFKRHSRRDSKWKDRQETLRRRHVRSVKAGLVEIPQEV